MFLQFHVICDGWNSFDNAEDNILDYIIGILGQLILSLAMMQYTALILCSYLDIRLEKGLNNDL